MRKPIELEKNPVEYDYEDYISAFFQSGGLYVERSIIHREEEEILELDIITTDFYERNISRKLIEIKSGKWGFSELFKVKGWLVYLDIADGVFIVKKEKESIDYYQKKAKELGIELIENSDLEKTAVCLQKFLYNEPKELEVDTIRFSYLLQRKLLKRIKDLKKQKPENQGFKNLDDYFHKINSDTFFLNNPIKRIKKLFNAYLKYKNITAKICYELESGSYDDDKEDLSRNCFRKTFYSTEDSPLQISLYVEHIARITILKCCTEHLLKNHKDSFGEEQFIESLDYLEIPNTIKNGLDEIVKEPYFHNYPIFWQFFTYVMGGFILTDLKYEEYAYIAENTGIPVEHIPNAFDSYNKLFPRERGWMISLYKSHIEWHNFFPPAFCGIGANHRRFLHLSHLEENEKSYDELEKLIQGDKTMADLNKWAILAYEILK